MPSIEDRLKEIMGTSSGREFANSLGKSSTTVNQYLHGRIPPADFIVLVCERHQVEPRWLLTGEGPKRMGEVPKAHISEVDEEALEVALDEADRLLESIGKRATSKQKTQLILALYAMASEREDRKIDQPTALRLVKLMAA
jgi:transcriptional regulator with XRE-family HTH domain